MAAPYPAQTAASLAASQTRRAAARAARPCACAAAAEPPRTRVHCRWLQIWHGSGLHVRTVAGIAQCTVLNGTPRYSTGLPGCANCRRAARCPHPATPLGQPRRVVGLQVAPEGGRAAHWRSRMRDLSTTTSARFRCNSASCGDGAAWQHGTGHDDVMHNWRTRSCRRGGL